MPYALLADLIVVTHFLFVGFVLFGQILIVIGALRRWAWVRRPVFRILHLLAIVVVAAEAILGIVCPLTTWEHWCRVQAGQQVEESISFVGRIVRGILFYELPTSAFTIIYVTFALLVVATMIFVPPRFRKATPPTERSGRRRSS